jgi:hypothetical protein
VFLPILSLINNALLFVQCGHNPTSICNIVLINVLLHIMINKEKYNMHTLLGSVVECCSKVKLRMVVLFISDWLFSPSSLRSIERIVVTDEVCTV